MSDVAVQPITGPFKATVTPPGSKSLTNRALVLAALAQGRCTLSNVLFADDTLVMLDCLGRLGFRLEIDRATHTVSVAGLGGKIPSNGAELFWEQRNDHPISDGSVRAWAGKVQPRRHPAHATATHRSTGRFNPEHGRARELPDE